MIRFKIAAVGIFAILGLSSVAPVALADQGNPGTAAQASLVRIKGTISDFNGAQITVKTTGGDFKAVQLTNTTKYYVNGKPVGQRPELDKGQHIGVLAHQETDGSLTALRVNVRQPKSGLVRIKGTISDFNAPSLTIKTKSGDFKAVQLTANTKYYVNGKPVSGRPELDKGQGVGVLAHQETDGSLTALRVNLVQPKSGTLRVKGTISDFNGAQVTIKTTGGDFKAVQLTDNTKYYVNGKPVSQRPELDKGLGIAVRAHQETDGSLTALRVNLRTS